MAGDGSNHIIDYVRYTGPCHPLQNYSYYISTKQIETYLLTFPKNDSICKQLRYEDLCSGKSHQGQGQVITSRSVCGM